MEAVFLKLVNMSLTASWLVLAVLILRLALKKAPRWILCALWGLVALRLVCPFSIESALSLIPSSEPLPKEIIYTAEPEINSGVPAIDQIVNPVLSESLTADGLTSANPTQIWSFILSHVWLVGMIAMLLYALGSFLLLKRRMATATLLRENIKQSELAASPFVLGIFRPTIYLPYAISEPDMAYVIAHEQAHIRRKDHWWKPLGFLLLSIYWFNPVLWLAYVLLCRDIEAACDEKVIADMEKDDRRAYSTALLNCSVHRRRIAACPLAFGEVGVKDRVKSVMNYKKPAFWIVVVAVIASIVVAVCFLTNPEGLRLDFSENEIVSASCFDMRSGSDEHTAKELNQAQIDELTSRLESLSGAKKSDRFAGLTAGYQISGKLENDTYIRVSGYALDHTGNVDIEWLGQRYVVTDQEFQEYLSRICEGGDVASAGEIPAAVPVTWVYAPMMSATWHAAFHFSFEMDYSHIEASCDEGEMWNLRALEAGQPHEKRLRFEAGQPVCWRPEIGGSLTDTTGAATVTFTVYDGGEILYTGTLDITRTAVENGMSLYEARLGGTDLLALRQENGNVGATVITVEAYGEMVSPETVIHEADLDHDGQNDRIHVQEVHPGQLYELSVSRQDGTLLWSTQAAYAHTGWNTILLCREGGKDYLVQYNPTMFQGVGSYGWTRFSLEGGRPVEIDSMYVDFELPLQMNDALRAFSEQTDRLLEDCTVLLSTEQFTPVIGPYEAAELPQFYPVRFDPDEIQTAMAAAAEQGDKLTMSRALREATMENSSLTRIVENNEVDSVRSGATMDVLKSAAKQLQVLQDPMAFDSHIGGVYLWLGDPGDRHISFFAGKEPFQVKIRYVGDNINESAVTENPQLYLFLMAAAEKENVELHDLDGDGMLEGIVWPFPMERRNTIIYDVFDGALQRIDVNETMACDASDFTGLIANIHPDYNCMIQIANDAGQADVYRYRDGEFSYVCPLNDVIGSAPPHATAVLSAEEIEAFNEMFAPIVFDRQGNPIGTNPWSCFFTSYYDDVRKLSFAEFMAYFPGGGSTASEEEFAALKELDTFPFRGEVSSLSDMPVPVNKHPARLIDLVLSAYAGITTADLDTSGVEYLATYDAYYNYTSDFGPGTFTCTRGEVEGDIVRLYDDESPFGTDVLTLRKEGENYRVIAHQKVDG